MTPILFVGERRSNLLAAAARIVPLSKTMGDRLSKLREWGATRARPATTPLAASSVGQERQIDLG